MFIATACESTVGPSSHHCANSIPNLVDACVSTLRRSSSFVEESSVQVNVSTHVSGTHPYEQHHAIVTVTALVER